MPKNLLDHWYQRASNVVESNAVNSYIHKAVMEMEPQEWRRHPWVPLHGGLHTMLHHELHSRALVFVERAIKIGSIRVHCHHSLARNYSHYNHHSRQETSAPDHAVVRSHRFPSHCLSADIYCKSIYQLKKLIEIVAGKHALSSLNNLTDDSLYINEVSCISVVVVSTEAPGAFYNGTLHHGWRGHPNSTL